MGEPVEISYAAFQAMEHDLEPGPIGDGRDRAGRPFWIRRYVSRTTGKIYDCVFVSGLDTVPRCMEMPKSDSAEPASPQRR